MNWLSDIEFYRIDYTGAELIPSGQNEQGFLIICNEEDFSNDNRDLLSNILKAIMIDLEKDCHLMALKNDQEMALNIIKKQHSYRKVLLFGVYGHRLGLHLPEEKYTWYTIGDVNILQGHKLEELSQDKSLKGNLWQAIKPLSESTSNT